METSQQPSRTRLKELLQVRVQGGQGASDTDSQASGPEPPSVVIPIRTSGSRPPLFCVQGGGASINSYRKLGEYLDEEQPVYAIQSPGLKDNLDALSSIKQMAAMQLAALRQSHPKGPICLCGHSIGAVIAWDMAWQLTQTGQSVSMLILIDQPGPDVRLNWLNWAYWQWVSISRLPWSHRLDYLRNGIRFRIRSRRWLPKWVKNLLVREKKRKSDTNRPERTSINQLRLDVISASIDAIKAYHPPPVAAPVALIRARSSAPRIHHDRWGGWGKVTGYRIHVTEIGGHHMNLFSSPIIHELAIHVNKLLQSPFEGEA